MMKMHKSLLAVLAGAVLAVAGCHDISDVPPELRPEIERLEARDAAMSPAGEARYRQLRSNGNELASFLTNTTILHSDALHGTQVEYLGADGRTALWYPGNAVPVFGQWKIKSSFDGPDVCFLYGSNTYDPVTGLAGGSWECGDASLYLTGMNEAVSGDIFKLMRGKIPFKVASGGTTLKQLAARAGVGAPGSNKVNW